LKVTNFYLHHLFWCSSWAVPIGIS